MNPDIIKRANELINSKTNYIGGGMEGYAILSLIDENGYPTASALTIAKADGINWLTFATSSDSNKAMRVGKCNRASVCIASSEYNVTLVGTVEVVTDIETKKATWLPIMDGNPYWTSYDDPNFCVLRFNAERYNIYFADDEESFAEGTLKSAETKTAPAMIPLFQFDRQCEEAIELYKKAFGAKVDVFMRFSDANPQDWSCDNADDKNLIYHAQMTIGDRRIILCDNLFNNLPRGHSIYPVMTFKNADEVKAAYNVLADGATIVSPMTGTTYSNCTVSLVDKFGIFWDLMVD